MHGLDAVQGLDQVALLAVLHRATSAKLARAILAGSVRLQKRLFEASIVVSSVCPFCGSADETLQHCFGIVFIGVPYVIFMAWKTVCAECRGPGVHWRAECFFTASACLV